MASLNSSDAAIVLPPSYQHRSTGWIMLPAKYARQRIKKPESASIYVKQRTKNGNFRRNWVDNANKLYHPPRRSQPCDDRL